MACNIVYRGNTYTQEEFNDYIRNNPAEFQSYLQNPPVQERPFTQVSNGPVPSVASPKTLKLVNEFLNKAGFDVRKVNQVTVNGKVVGANGVADMLTKMIQVVNGREDTVLPEEAMHVAVEMIEQQNPYLFQKMLNSIGQYQMYSDVFDTYQNSPFYQKDGKPDIRKIKKEAMARVLVETIIQKTEGATEKPENLKRAGDWWRSIIEWFKQLFNRYGNPFKEAVSLVEEGTTAQERNAEVFFSRNPNQVNASMKVVQALLSSKMGQVFNRFYANNKDKFYQELNQLSPKAQVDMLRNWNKENNPTSIDDMVTGVLSQLSYTIEINTAKRPAYKANMKDYGTIQHFVLEGVPYEADLRVPTYAKYDPETRGIIIISKEEYEKAFNAFAVDKTPINTDYYSGLTVPGGTNYEENEIAIPDITPSIKGHTEFSTENGIGWFRSDEQLGQQSSRRILEIQSDLFQKGRNRDNLTGELQNDSQNSFLQLLNKDNNWVTFFVKSVIQDSAKRGYQSILFPLGETAVSAANVLESIEPVHNFYENAISNILKKQGYNPVEITDEYGNRWNQVSINQDRDLSEFYFQLSEGSQTQVYNDLLTTHNNMALVQNLDDPDRSYYTINGKRVANRVSDKTKDYYSKKFRSKQVNESEFSRAINDQKKEKGTDGHKDLENMLHRLVDDNGFLRAEPLDQGSPSNLDPNNNTYYNTLWQNMVERVHSYPAGTRFMAEVKIYDKAEDEGGTIDFLAITPDGKINVLDWKFIDLREGETDIPWYKREAYNIQLSEYKRILRDNYKVKKEDFGQTRVVPIRAKYRFDPAQADRIKLTDVQIGSVDVKAIQDNTVLPVPTRDESTGSAKLDSLIAGLYNLMDKIYDTRVKPGEEYKKIERLNELVSAVRQLHVKGATTQFLDFVFEDIRGQIYPIFEPYIGLVDTINNKNSSSAEKQDARDKLNSLSNVNQLSHDILDNYDILTLYADVNKALRDVIDPRAKENKQMFSRAEEVVADAEINIDMLVNLSNALRSNPIARGLGVEDVLDPELSVSFYQKWVRSLSQAATTATEMLWHIVNRISNNLQIEFSDEVEELKKLEKGVSDYQKTTGKSWNDIERMILNFNSKDRWNGKVISQISQEFYTELEKAKVNKDIERIHQIVDVDKYMEWYEQELANREESYRNRRLFAEDERDEREKAKRIEDFKKQFNIIEETSTALSPANRMLNMYPNTEEFESDKYKELKQPGNEPIKALYDYWQKKLNESYDLGLIKSWERRTFFPNVRKDFLDHMAFGVAKNSLKRVGNAVLSVLNNIDIQVDDETFGYTDINGNPQDKLSALYTYDLGIKKTDEDGAEFTDYTNKSTDIFSVMALWNKEMIKYKHKSEVVDIARLIHFTETNRKAQGRSKLSGKPAVKETGDPVLVDNVINSEYYKSFMDYYFYGKRLSEGQDVRFTVPYNKVARKLNTFFKSNVFPVTEGEEITISGKKAIQAANRWFQMKTLGLNVSTAASNLFGGTANVLINSGKFFTKADFGRGQLIITSGKLWGENSVYAGLIDYFLPLTEDTTRDKINELSVSRTVRFLSSDHLFYLQRGSDKLVQYPAFIAFAENTMVEDGKLVNIREWVKQKHNYDNIYNLPLEDQKNLRKTIEDEISSLKETRSLPKISTIEDDKLVIPGVERNSSTVFELRNRVQQFAKDALGNMSEEDISLYRTSLLGQSFMLFKNWIPRMADVRFGEMRFQPGTDSYEWGRMRMLFSSLKYGILNGVSSIIKTLGGKNAGTIEIARKLYEEKKAEFEKRGKTFDMTEAEFIDRYVKGVRAQVKELAALVSMMALLFYAKSQAPDPDEDARSRGAYKWAVRMFDKMTDELGFFYNPISFTAIANGSIFPSIQILNDIYRLMRGVTLEGFYMVTNNEPAAEKNKVAKYLFRTFPVTKELTLYTAMFNEELAKEYGVRISTESRRIQ